MARSYARPTATKPRPGAASGPSTASPFLSAASSQVGWVLLPLRAFLAVVFLYAGISKVADRQFLDDHSLTGLHATLVAVRGASPVGSLLGPVESHSLAFGLIFSIGEIAVGLGLLLGAFTRVAALGGLLLSLSFFLTVSWSASPWYTGADIGYLFALTPLVFGGSGGLYSLDAWLARAARQRPGPTADHTRRALVGGSVAVGVFALLGIGALSRGSSKSGSAATRGADTTGAGTTGAPASGSAASGGGGAELAATAAVAVGGAKQVKDPKTGDPTFVLQLSAGQFTALSAVCPHQQCTVGFVSPSGGFVCPCHGSRFAADGKLLQGPATRGLTAIPVTVVDGTVRRA